MASKQTKVSNLRIEDIAIGDLFEIDRTFSPEDVDNFAALSGDFSPLHVDAGYASGTEFGERVVHGILLASLFSNLVGMKIPGKQALYLAQDLAFRKPVFINEALTVRAKVTARNLATSTIVLATEIRNSAGKVVVSGSAKVRIRETSQLLEPSNEPANSPATRSGKPVAVISGGSRGVGGAISRKLASENYHCVILYRSNDHQARLLLRDVEENGGSASIFKIDISEEAEIDALCKILAEDFGQVTALVNSAIGDLDQIPATELTWENFAYYFDTQVKGVMSLSQKLHPLMCLNGRGAIVSILSQVVNNTPPSGMAHYVTAKYALLGLSKALAAEWAKDNIRVNMVSPGLARTELTQHYNEKIFRMEEIKTPLGRLVDVKDIAESVAYLLSESSNFISGANLYLTGGQDMP